MRQKKVLQRMLRLAMSMTAAVALAGCAVASTPAKEAAESAVNLRVVQEQVQPALRLARASRAAGDLASAVNLYRTVLAAYPGDGPLTVEFGDVMLEAGAFDEAIDAYDKVKDADPARLGALLGLSRVQLALGEPEKALAFSELARTKAPSDTRVLLRRGVALDMLGRHAEAQGSYNVVLAADPRNVAARNDLALSFAIGGHFTEAIDILTPMAKSSTASPRTRQNLALVYGLMGDNTRAAEFGRADLAKAQVESNLRFFDYARETR